MRTTIALVAAAVVVFLAGWWIDDQLLGNDVPRRVHVGEVDIGDMAADDALAALEAAGFASQPIALEWAGTTAVFSADELGVTIDADAAVSQAQDRGSSITQPLRWARSLFSDRSVEPEYRIDTDRLAAIFGTGPDAVFPLDFGRPMIELVDGEFVEADPMEVPRVAVEELERLVLAAVARQSGETERIEVPISGRESVDLGAASLIERAEDLTDNGLRVKIVGSSFTNYVSQDTIKSWLVFGGTREEPTLELDEELVLDSLVSREWGFRFAEEEATFVIDDRGEVRIVGPIGTGCCAADTTIRIMEALEADEREVELLATGDDPERGIAWAQTLGIEELVGEFTTYYKPGQSRVINIQRIAEITQGVIIPPGETFSVNEFVGRRTTDNGFVAAGMIVNGLFQPSVGGGISQYATTLFNAAFFAGLDFGEYQSHSIYIKRYPYGREATVSYPRPNLEIVNNTPHHVLIWPTTNESSITVRPYSTPWAIGEQTDQTEGRVGVSCTLVTTERTRTFVEDGRTETDTVTARYRPEGRACDGSSTRTTTTTSTVPAPTTVPPPTSTTSVPPTTTASTTTTTAAPTTTTVPPTTTTGSGG